MDNKKDSTFGIDKEQQAKVIFPGQDRVLYGTHSPGPGMYNSTENLGNTLINIWLYIVNLSSIRNMSQFSIPKQDRGLLTMKRDEAPNPFTYKNSSDIYIKVMGKSSSVFSMPKQERNFNFAKFNSLHMVLVKKGL